jgi:hypothetical protein
VTESLAQLRDRLRPLHTVPRRATGPDPELITPEKAFVVTGNARTLITGPASMWEKAAVRHAGFMYVAGRYVEAERANRNGAFWSTKDLELGQPTVAGGPLNWLHEEKEIIGALLESKLVYSREAARDFSEKERKQAADKGQARSDGSFPIKNAQDLKNAIRLAGNAKDPAAAKRHIISRAKALGLTSLLPDTWNSEKASEDPGTHIQALAAVWKFLRPEKALALERHANDKQLWLSMECVSQNIECVTGCGESFSYSDWMTARHRVCAHLQAGAPRRFVDPVFLGAGVIVPPVRPGWANAEAEILREAAALTEEHTLDDALTRDEAEHMVAAILSWANEA